MKKSIIFLILCFVSIMIVSIHNVKIKGKAEETIKLESEKLISNSKIKKDLIISESDYIEEQTTEKTTINQFEKIGILLPDDTTPIISKMGYKVSTESFKDIAKETENINRNIVIKYPQLIGLKNKSLQNKINKEIKNSALEPYYYLKKDQLNNNDDDYYYFDNMQWIVDYVIEYIDKNIISIVFRGDRYALDKEDHYTKSTYEIYSVNINLNTGKKIRIDELFENSFKQVLKWNKLNYCFYNYIYENKEKGKPENTTSDYTIGIHLMEYMDGLPYKFDKSYDNFYIKSNKFMFIIFAHSSDFTFAADYFDLMDSIKWENEIWSGVFKKERG